MSNSPIEHHVGHIEPDSIHIPDHAWEVMEVTEDYVRSRAPLERFADGNVLYVYRTVPRGLPAFLDANKASMDESETQKTRFGGDSSVLVRKISSIPLNEFFNPANQLAEKIKEGDRDHIRWFLNRDEARPWRTFRGKV